MSGRRDRSYYLENIPLAEAAHSLDTCHSERSGAK